MEQQNEKFDPLFINLVSSLQAGAMLQMGKMANPQTGKVERDLNAAKFSIDLLGMIEAKTKGNLTEDEAKLVSRALYELRLNFVDEQKKGDGAEAAEDKPADSAPATEDGSKDDAPGDSE